MKKINLTGIFVLVVLCSFGQGRRLSDTAHPRIVIAKETRFTINIHKGYAFGMGSTFKFYPDDISAIAVMQKGDNAPSTTIEYANPTKGLGDGFRTGFGLSYILNDFINIGLDFDHFNSTIQKRRDSTFQRTDIPSTNGGFDEVRYAQQQTITYKATLLSLTPNVMFKAISRPKWFLYNKVGAVITFRPNSLQNDKTTSQTSRGRQGVFKDSLSMVTTKYEWSIRNPAFGFMAAVGAQVKLGKNVRGFAEAQFSHIVFVIRKRTLTNLTVDNKAMEGSLPVNMRELVFVRSYSSNNLSNDPNQPAQTLLQRIPITYVGIQAGVVFQL